MPGGETSVQQTHQEQEAHQQPGASGGQRNDDEQAIEASRDDQGVEDADCWT